MSVYLRLIYTCVCTLHYHLLHLQGFTCRRECETERDRDPPLPDAPFVAFVEPQPHHTTALKSWRKNWNLPTFVIVIANCELCSLFAVLEFRFRFWFWTMFDETFDNFDLTYYWHDKTAKRYFFRLFAKPFIHSMRHLLVLHLQCKRRCFRDLGTKVEKIWDKMNLTGCNWSGLNAPGAETPVFHPLLVGSLFPFPLSGAIRNGGPQYQYQMLGTFWKKISLTGRKCSSLNAPDIETPVSYSLLGDSLLPSLLSL